MSDTASTKKGSEDLNAGADAFLRELQQEFLSDPEGHLRMMREAHAEVFADPVRCLRSVRKVCQAIPPLADPVGFKHLATLVRELESILHDLEESYRSLSGGCQDDDTKVLEFFLGDAITSVESYYTDLKSDAVDSESRADERRPCMRVLAHWRPTGATVAQVTTPVATETAAPALLTEEALIEMLAPVPAPARVPAPTPTPTPVPAAPEIENVVPLRPMHADENPHATLTHQYLICRASVAEERNQSRTFAIPVRQVLEVIDYQVVNPLPYPRAGIAGMLNFRGDPLPILVCEDHGGDRAAAAWQRKGYIVIARIDDRTFGFQMEQVLSVTTLNPTEFQQPEGVFEKSASTWITHLARVEADVLMVMDLNRALAA